MSDRIEVLIVEDNDDTAATLRSLLVFHGYTAAKVATKAEASEWFATHEGLRAIIIDVTLPDGSGISLIEEIHDRYPDCRVIIISGYDEQHWGSELSGIRPDDIIMKPIDLKKLRKQLPEPEKSPT
jgi:two-component system, response regulator YesN